MVSAHVVTNENCRRRNLILVADIRKYNITSAHMRDVIRSAYVLAIIKELELNRIVTTEMP